MNEVFDTLCSHFNLGRVIDVRTGTRGVTSSKFKVKTEKGTYFIKAIKNVSDQRLHIVHDIEQFMGSKGIPVVPALPDTQALWLRIGDTAYKPAPFIEFVPKTTLSTEDFRNAGSILGKIHWASQDAPRRFFENTIGHVETEPTLAKLKEIRTSLANDQKEDAAKLLEHLDYKMELLPRLPKGSVEICDSLIHGDYTPGNLLINTEGKILAVCDWESVRYYSRAFEVAYFIVYACFNPRAEYAEAVTHSRAFLRGYRSEYPLIEIEVRDGFEAYTYSLASAAALEREFLGPNRFPMVALAAHERTLMEQLVSGKMVQDILAA
jgi:Ser/Thr protein kinase RdoA (MazF antagonist)